MPSPNAGPIHIPSPNKADRIPSLLSTPTLPSHTLSNGHATNHTVHPLSTISRSTAHIFGDGIAEGMPTRPSLRRALEGSFAVVDAVAGEGATFRARSRTNSARESLEEGTRASGEGSEPDETLSTRRKVGQPPAPAGVEVIVHEVQPDDSLEGIALKYGVPLAALRRTNKLWASDTIHLRRTLYIPISKSPVSQSLPHSPSMLVPPTLFHKSCSTSSLLLPSPAMVQGERKIIPKEELSFFPPSTTTPALDERRENVPRILPPIGTTLNGLPKSPSPSSSPRPHTIVDIFRSLPDISAIGRRSVESLMSAGSARDEVSAAREHGMEMDERTQRRFDEPMKPSADMVIRRGGAQGTDEEDDDW